MFVRNCFLLSVCVFTVLSSANAATLQELEDAQARAQQAKLAPPPQVAPAAALRQPRTAGSLSNCNVEIRSIGGVGDQLQANLVADGRELPTVREGDELPGGCRIERIEPRKVCLAKGAGKRVQRRCVMFVGGIPAPTLDEPAGSGGAMPEGMPAARLPLAR